MLKRMIFHTLLAVLSIGALGIAYQAAAEGSASITTLWAASRHHDD